MGFITMKKVNILKSETGDLKYIKPVIVKYQRDNESVRSWEMIKRNDSVHILIDKIDTKELILVKQIRIPVLNNNSSKYYEDGVVIESCAGLVDKHGKNLYEIAKEEIEEEVGYSVSEKDIKYVREYVSEVGLSGHSSHIFKVNVTDNDKISDGGGIDSEDIEVVYVKYSDVKSLLYNGGIDLITSVILSLWLLDHKDEY